MKKTNARGAKCTSITSTLKCVLDGDHAVHSTSLTPNKGQRATWTLTDDGRFDVKTFSGGGKMMAHWFDDAPPAAATKSNLCGVRWERAGDGTRIPKEQQIGCGRDPGHDGPHRGFAIEGNHVTEWDSRPGATHLPKDRFDERTLRPKMLAEADEAIDKTHADEAREIGALAKIGEHEVHPAAALFPMISDADRPSFVEDIRENGQRKKIVRIGKLILDGRNRLSACLELGIKPQFRDFGNENGDGEDPIAFVVSENIHRRHLNETQRSFVGAELIPMCEAQARERMLAGKAPDPTANVRQGSSAENAARMVNVSARSIENALKVNRDAAPEVIAAAKERGELKVSAAAELATLPKAKQREIVEKMGSGEMRAGKVRAHVKQEKKRAVVNAINAQQVGEMPEGPFRVIVCDWPWFYDNSDQHEGSRGHIPYPGMPVEDALAMAPKLDELAHEDGCVLGFWTTNAFMPDAVRIVEAWGFTWRTIRTWDKERDGIGTWCRSRTEHLIIAERGEVEHTLNEVSTLIRELRREHSRKPEEPMAVFEKHCSGPMLEMFAREPRAGWARWGAETEKFATEAA